MLRSLFHDDVIALDNCDRFPGADFPENALPFNTFRAIEAIESFDRFEAIVVAIWVVADFIIITFCQGFAGYHIDVAEPKFFSTPAVLKGYIGSMYLPRNRTELELINICRAAG